MSSRLALVPQVAPAPSARPFRTFYYGPKAREAEWSHRGSAGTRKGAIIAAMRWVIERRAESAVIYNEDGVVCARVARQPRGRILVIGV